MIEPLETRIAPAALASAFQVANVLHANSVVGADAQGDVIIAGVFLNSISLDTSGHKLTTSNPEGNLYVAKYTPAGALVWSAQWGGTGAEEVGGITTDSNGDVYLTGTFFGSNFGFGGSGTLTAAGATDVFVLKISGATGAADTTFGSGSGQLQWGGQAGGATGPESGTGYSIAFDPSVTAVVVAGSFSSTSAGFPGVGNPTISSVGGTDAFAFEIDPGTGAPIATFGNGGMVSFGTTNDDFFTKVVPDGGGNLFLAYMSNVSGPGGTANVVKLSDSTGAAASGFGTSGIIPLPLSSGVKFAQSVNLALDAGGNVVAVQGALPETDVFHLDPGSGALQSTFGKNGEVVLKIPAISQATPIVQTEGGVQVVTDAQSNIYVLGSSITGGFLAQISSSGILLHTNTVQAGVLSAAFDPNGFVLVRGFYAGNPNLDLTGSTFNLPAPSVKILGPNMEAGIVERIDVSAINSANSFTYGDGDGNLDTITLTGPGYAHYQIDSSGDLASLQIFNTTLASALSVTSKHTGDGPAVALQVSTQAPDQDIGSISFSPDFILGDGLVDPSPTIEVSGLINNLNLPALSQDVVIEIGNGVPAAQIVNEHPNLTVEAALGPGVQIDVLPNATDPNIGGGGLGNVVLQSWNFAGLIQTTHSIGNFTVEQVAVPEFFLSDSQPFLGVLKVGPTTAAPFLVLHDHPQNTTSNAANVGNMTVENGSWGSSGNIIEGNIASFNAPAFLAGASITAGSITKVNVTGQFAGTLDLTDGSAASVGTFTVNSDFTGAVISAQALRKIKIKGNFTGALQAPGIAAITAFSFLGTAPADPGDPYPDYIKVTDGILGTIKATSGIVENYQLTTSNSFAGINVTAKNLTQDTVGIENVQITAASIGKITVHLSAAKTAGGIQLKGIDESMFSTTASGTTKGTTGNIGNISVTLAGAAGVTNETGISNTSFNARAADATVNALGKIAVKLAGGTGKSTGFDTDDFEGNSIGATSLSVSPGAGGTATGVSDTTYTADKTIGPIAISGDFTSPAAMGLDVWAGGAIGAISIKSKTAANGSLSDSAILAGQNLTFPLDVDAKTALALLHSSALGTVTLSGALSGTTLAAGSNIGAVTVGGEADTSLILAGSVLGGDHQVGGGDDLFQRAASISAVTVKGDFSSTTIAAGVDPVTGVFGDGDDVLAGAAGPLTQRSSVGAISIGSGAIISPATMTHQYAIEAAAIKQLTISHVAPVKNFTSPIVIDTNANGEDNADVLVQLLQ